MKIQKCLQKILILLVFLIAANGAKAQTLNFILSKDTINTSDLLTITNTSTGFNSNSRFYWEFETCDFYINDTTVICNTTTTGISQNITGKFYHDCYCLITLKALDSLGNVITTIPFSYKTIYVQLLNQLICETVSCHDPMPWNSCEYVCNGDFEWYNPLCIDDQGQLCIAEPWQISHQGNMPGSSPDYFNSCFTGPCPGGVPPNAMCMDVPANYHSQNQPSCGGGNGYAGFIAISGTSANDQQREYIQQPLKYSLIPGNTYHIKMYLSHDGRSDLACNKIKLYFSNGQPVQAPWGLFPNVIQNQLTSPSVLMTNHTWTQYSADFVAPTGTNLNWVSIGVFDQFSQINITTGNHETYYNTHPPVFSHVAYYFIDSISIKYAPIITATAFPTSICNSSCTNLSASGASTYTWMPGNLTGSTVNVCPTTTTTYTVIGNSASGCTGSATITVQVVAPPQMPIIIGNHNSCDTIAAYYTISNFNLNNTYFWRIGDDNYSGSFPQYGSSIVVSWNPSYTIGTAEYTWLYVEVTDNNTGCTSEDSIKIWKCCRKNEQSLAFNDTIITSANIFSVWPPPVFNGNVIVNQNISVNNIDYILMGPEAKIIVNPQYTFTITTSSIGAGCGYMWDGIYVTDSNAKVVINSNSTVKEALNGVVSENGGKFELKNSNFYNNSTSVLVKNNYWGPYLYPFTGYLHKGIIYGCLFSQNGSMINPCLGQKPRYGVYCDNVDKLTIGDSIISSNTNTFRNLYCGVYSKNANVKLVNNNFRRIKPSSLCQMVYPEVFTTQYCETAVFSISTTTNNLGPLCASALSCGGNSTITRNTFDTCNMAVYTYRTTTKLTKNKIYNTTTGIKCRDIRAGSFITHSLIKTNTPTGIQIINTVPTLTKVSVMYDSIIDPTSGIYLMNITSHATNSALKSVVSNNFISNAKNTSVYGINLEKCDRIEVYCNKVTRIAIPATAYRLYIKGIQISQCENALIHDNISERIGLSIKGAGSLLGTQFKCNTSNGSFNGFYFDAAYGTVQTALSSQGIATLPNDNKWLNVPANYFGIDAGSTFTLGTPITWYYRSVGTQYNPSISIPANNGGIYKMSAGNPIQYSCTTCGGMFMAGMSSSILGASNAINETEIENIINETNNYNELDASFKYFERQYAFHLLDANTQLLNGTTGSYYYDLKNGNIGKFDEIYRKIEAGDINNASLLNNQIAPVNSIEHYRKWVNAVYFDYIVTQKEIPQNIIEDLEILASSSPFVNGDAVYTARAIVGYTESVINPKSLEQENDSNSSSGFTAKVYPNPANDKLFIEIKGSGDEKLNFVVLNSLGVKLKEVSLQKNTVIDVSRLSNGLYFYQILRTFNKEISSKGRFVISR